STETHLRPFDIMRGRSGFIDEPLGDDLFVSPATAAKRAIADSRQIAGRHSQGMRRVSAVSGVAVLAAPVKVFKRPMLATNRFEQSINGELVVWSTGDVFAYERGVIQGKRGIAASRAGIKCELGGQRIAIVAEHMFPRPFIPGAGRLGTDARSMVEQLFDGDLCLARITKRLSPGNEIDRRVVERHFPGGSALPALFGSDGQHGGADRLRDGCHAARARLAAVSALDF